MELTQRFINYVKIDTQSDPDSHTTPSTHKQYDLANLLVKELKELGVKDAKVTDKCIVYGHIPSNSDNQEKIGFIAHLDTSNAMSGANCKPRIIKNYDGKTIVLNEELNIKMSPSDFPILNKDLGSDLIVTDGTSLLGADDKAGIAEIMNLVQYCHDHPEYKHQNISICFTPDEEIGEGADNFDLLEFNANKAYTVDGGVASDVDFENFNAASAQIEINGLSIHPGDSKDKMINALLVAMEFNALLPEKDRPVNTEGYEGFNHLIYLSGEVEKAQMAYIIRNHDVALLEKQKQDFIRAKDLINQKYKEDTIVLTLEDGYRNMKEIIEKDMSIVNKPLQILKDLGLEAKSSPIRGGTDGARITYMGLPCPNLGTGGRNYHGKFEYANIQEMEIIAKLLIELAKA